MMKFTKQFTTPQVFFFTCISLAASLASALGTSDFIKFEVSDVFMALAGGFGLSVLIYACWDVVFNQTGSQKKTAALLIALVASAVSIATLYQNAMRPVIKAQTTAQQTKQTKADNKNNTVTTSLQDQQASIKTQIADLKAQNTKDLDRIDDLQTLLDKGIHPKTNRKAIKNLRSDIKERNSNIDRWQEQSLAITDRLTEKTPASPIAESTTTAWWQHLHIGTLARASLYDFMAFFFILVRSWYRKEKANETEQETNQLAQITAQYQNILEQSNTALTALEEKQQSVAALLKTKTASHEQIQQAQQQLDKTLTASKQQQRDVMSATQSAIAATDELSKQNKQARAQKKNLQHSMALATDVVDAAENLIVNRQRLTIKKENPIVNDQRLDSAIDADDVEIQSALKLLEAQKIQPSESGYHTEESLMKATGMSQTKCRKLKKIAVEVGVLESIKRGNGHVLQYPDQNQAEIIQFDLIKEKQA